MNTLFVLGARRSGTNFLENLIIENSHFNVANLNAKQSQFLVKNTRRPYLYQEYGLKHDVSTIIKLNEHRDSCIVLIRNPLDWIDARYRYAVQHMGRKIEDVVLDLDKFISREYNEFYSTAIANKFSIVRYEDLKKGVVALKETPMFSMVELENEVKIDREVKPGGGLGRAYRKKEYALSANILRDKTPIFNPDVVSDFYKI